MIQVEIEGLELELRNRELEAGIGGVKIWGYEGGGRGYEQHSHLPSLSLSLPRPKRPIR